MTAHAPVRIYGTSCTNCGALMVRGPSDPELCAQCLEDRQREARGR